MHTTWLSKILYVQQILTKAQIEFIGFQYYL
jgi:hypothetical protein